MKIGLLTTSFPRHPNDIAGNFVLGFARTLAGRGHQVEVLAPEPAELPEGGQPPHWPGVELTWVRYLRPRSLQRTFYGAGVPDNLRRDPRAWLGPLPFTQSLYATAAGRSSSWDAVVSHWALPCGWVAANLPNRPTHLAVMHSADVHALEKLPGGGMLATQVARGSDAMLFVSLELRRRFLARIGAVRRVDASGISHVCPMGIDPYVPPPSDRRTLRRTHALKGLTLLSVGRLIDLKGLAHAIDAVAGMGGVELIIAGEGPARPLLEQRAVERQAAVRFVGWIDPIQRAEWLRACDIFVLPSIRTGSGRTEGAPTALLEAMDAGLVPIASRVGGIPEMLEDGANGLLVAPADVPALQGAIESLRERAVRKRMGARAARTARDFHWSAIGPQLERLLR